MSEIFESRDIVRVRQGLSPSFMDKEKRYRVLKVKNYELNHLPVSLGTPFGPHGHPQCVTLTELEDGEPLSCSGFWLEKI